MYDNTKHSFGDLPDCGRRQVSDGVNHSFYRMNTKKMPFIYFAAACAVSATNGAFSAHSSTLPLHTDLHRNSMVGSQKSHVLILDRL